MHPSEKNNDLLKNISTVIINKKNINFSVDKNLSITKSLYEADIVIGGETYAMVLALKLKKKYIHIYQLKVTHLIYLLKKLKRFRIV